MQLRILPCLLAALALTAAGAHAQGGRAPQALLPAFASDAELSGYLRALEEEYERRRPPTPPYQPSQEPPCAAPTTSAVSVAAAAAISDSAVIAGVVTDESGNPLSLGVVRAGPSSRVETNAEGGFRLVVPAPPAGHDVVVIAARVGHSTRSLTMRLSAGDSATVRFPLCGVVVELQQMVATNVVVTGAASESVTNTQHGGVDEGGIVKVHGDHLVMLRRGRLFTVAIGNERLTPVSAVDAFGPGIDDGDAWYDEMLIYGDRVVVIGFSYALSSTEIGVFGIDRAGRLSHQDTYHLRSNDYYSSRNYASRLIGSRLVLYAPIPLEDADAAASLPALRRWRVGADSTGFERIIAPGRVYRPGRKLDLEDGPTLHAVVLCDLAGPELRCEASAVLGPEGRVFYVSPTAVYVWTSDGTRGRGLVRAPSMVYRLPLDGSPPSALGVAGSPVDQFSFLESGDGHLNVLVSSGAAGDGMWDAEVVGGDVSLLRVPLHTFGDGRGSAPRDRYRALPRPSEGDALHNRFVGRHLLYGTGSGWGEPDDAGRSVLHVVPWRGGRAAALDLPHGVDRIEVMGSDAVVVGADSANLHFTGITLGPRPRAAQRYVSLGASQGELRSHGFFYRPDGPDAGVLGLPIRGPGRPGYEHLFDESASVLFLRNAARRFAELGRLAAHDKGAVDDGCVASCVDWYGNSRPLFLRGRVFALMGYELVEGAVRGGRIREVQRISYAPPPAVATAP